MRQALCTELELLDLAAAGHHPEGHGLNCLSAAGLQLYRCPAGLVRRAPTPREAQASQALQCMALGVWGTGKPRPPALGLALGVSRIERYSATSSSSSRGSSDRGKLLLGLAMIDPANRACLRAAAGGVAAEGPAKRMKDHRVGSKVAFLIGPRAMLRSPSHDCSWAPLSPALSHVSPLLTVPQRPPNLSSHLYSTAYPSLHPQPSPASSERQLRPLQRHFCSPIRLGQASN